MNFGSLFTGVGGFDLGLEQAGHKCVWQAESDKFCNEVLDYRFPNVKRFVNVQEVNENAEDVELIVGGFPCQSFSLAGKRKGFADTRGTLFFEFARILKQKQPQTCIIENVRGLLSHDKGRTFQVILATLDELGYDAEWQLLNSKNFGVPQNRNRIFIIGHLRGRSRRQVFPLRQDNGATIKYVRKSDHLQDRIYDEKGISPTMITGTGGNLQPKIIAVQDSKVLERNIVNTIDASYFKGLDNHQQRSGVIVASRGRNLENPHDRTLGIPTEQRLEPNSQGLTNTLTSVQKDNWYVKGTRIRRLTPTECERLQGFPDGWTKYGIRDGGRIEVSDTQRYKQMGNAVTVPLIKVLGDKVNG